MAAHPRPGGQTGDARPCQGPHGNRRLKHALHIAAIVQRRFDYEGRRYYLRKIGGDAEPRSAQGRAEGGLIRAVSGDVAEDERQ
jgi:hypothetical protein